MVDITTVADLDRVLVQLRAVRSDHQWVEAKRARHALPDDLWTSLSAFANSDLGGLVLLGVAEEHGNFVVTGVEEPGMLTAALQSACSQLDPPLRPQINFIDHPDGVVIVAPISPLPRNMRPCHRSDRGPRESSYIRVGDADERMKPSEVDDLLANKSGTDYSRRPAPEGATLDPLQVAQLLTTARQRNPRHAELDDSRLLFTLGATNNLEHPSLAGLLVLGHTPQLLSAAARVAYRRLPTLRDPQGARLAGRHVEGHYGEILDDLMTAFTGDLEVVQIVVDGQVRDELDIPRETLREICSNALVHRSLAEPLDATPIEIEVSERMVVVTSPGGLHVATDLRSLGLGAMSSPRNLSLVRLCEMATTPTGARIVESQASGIAAADRACRRAGTMPPLFVSRAAQFEAVLLRGALPVTAVLHRWNGIDVNLTDDEARLVAACEILEELHNEDATSHLAGTYLDAVLAARLLTSSTERGAQRLGDLSDAGVLAARDLPDRTVWTPRSPGIIAAPSESRSRTSNQVIKLLAALANSPSGELGTKDLLEPLGVESNRSVTNVVTRAIERGLVEPTREGTHDPNRKYRLTETGRHNLTSIVAPLTDP